MRYHWVWLGLAGLLVADLCFLYWWLRPRSPAQFQSEILRASARYEVDPALVKAVIWRESAFKPQARGRAGEIGLMQIRALAAQEWAEAERIVPFAHEQVSDPGTNTLAGAWYLGKLLSRYSHTDDPLPFALADYNAGRTHVLRWMEGEARTNSASFMERIDFPGTRHYIATVTAKYAEYREAGAGSRSTSGKHRKNSRP